MVVVVVPTFAQGDSRRRKEIISARIGRVKADACPNKVAEGVFTVKVP